MTLLLGLDCATLPQKTGLAIGTLVNNHLQVNSVSLASTASPVVDTLLSWITEQDEPNDFLLCIDAPLGWPKPMGHLLADHQAGDLLSHEPNLFFRRETDRYVRRTLGKLPLDVGADRIARTAHQALSILGELRSRTGLEIPLPLKPGPQPLSSAIEVYPAATLLAHGMKATGYKGPSGAGIRAGIMTQLNKQVEFNTNTDPITANDDIFDAVLCLIAGRDFLLEEVYPPQDLYQAAKEGWIWVKRII